MEKAAGRGARGCQPEPRCGAEDSPGAHPLPRELGLGERRGHCQRAREPTAPHFPAPRRLLLPSHRHICAAAQTSLKIVEFLGTTWCVSYINSLKKKKKKEIKKKGQNIFIQPVNEKIKIKMRDCYCQAFMDLFLANRLFHFS